MLPEVQDEILFADDEEEEAGWFLIPHACAEGAVEVESIPEGDGLMPPPAEWELPMNDFTAPPKADSSRFTSNSYEDETLRVTLEEIEEEQVRWVIARIELSSPCQLRTAYAKPAALVSNMAAINNAVIAISGDYMDNNPKKTSYEVRMGKEYRRKSNRLKDMLVIDDQGDFHLYRNSEGLFEKKGNKVIFDGTIVNAFTFGPALVIDGAVQSMGDREYGYNPDGREPRAAIGQTGKLSYVFVLASASDRNGKTGVNHQELANKMGEIGCLQAFNLDGGGTAEIVFNGEIYRASPGEKERAQSDMIYVGTLVPEGK